MTQNTPHTRTKYPPTPLEHPLHAPPSPQNALKLSRKVDKCKPLLTGTSAAPAAPAQPSKKAAARQGLLRKPPLPLPPLHRSSPGTKR